VHSPSTTQSTTVCLVDVCGCACAWPQIKEAVKNDAKEAALEKHAEFLEAKRAELELVISRFCFSIHLYALFTL
jgi:hypothetical protein